MMQKKTYKTIFRLKTFETAATAPKPSSIGARGGIAASRPLKQRRLRRFLNGAECLVLLRLKTFETAATAPSSLKLRQPPFLTASRPLKQRRLRLPSLQSLTINP